MSVRVDIRRIAQRDVEDAADWMEQRRPGSGVAFQAAVRRVLAEIEANPLRFAVVQDEVRGADVPRYPYVIYFITDDIVADVFAVIHTSRDPAIWQARI